MPKRGLQEPYRMSAAWYAWGYVAIVINTTIAFAFSAYCPYRWLSFVLAVILGVFNYLHLRLLQEQGWWR